ncbi:hypothetical protein RSOL_401170, partial [Rhizoctonia solani AG-3 Rhs1AP]
MPRAESPPETPQHVTQSKDTIPPSRGCSRVQDARMSLDPWATPADRMPLYVVYLGPIQGAWSNVENVRKIAALNIPFRFCTAYTWKEALYVRAAGESFADIAAGRPGWPRLHAVLLDLFGNEASFILGPTLVDMLENINKSTPSPTLTSALKQIRRRHSRRFSYLAPDHPSYEPATRASTRISSMRPRPSRLIFQIPKTTTSLGINKDVAVAMHIFDSQVMEHWGPSHANDCRQSASKLPLTRIRKEDIGESPSLVELEKKERSGEAFEEDWGPMPARS